MRRLFEKVSEEGEVENAAVVKAKHLYQSCMNSGEQISPLYLYIHTDRSVGTIEKSNRKKKKNNCDSENFI